MPLKFSKSKKALGAKGSAQIEKKTVNNSTGDEEVTENTTESVDAPETLAAHTELPMCVVGFSAGITKNLGDYNSGKVQVTLHMPVKHEDIDDAYQFTKQWVEERLQQSLEEFG